MNFSSYREAVTNWGRGEVILKVRKHNVNVDIKKLMIYPSQASAELGGHRLLR